MGIFSGQQTPHELTYQSSDDGRHEQKTNEERLERETVHYTLLQPKTKQLFRVSIFPLTTGDSQCDRYDRSKVRRIVLQNACASMCVQCEWVGCMSTSIKPVSN